MRETEEPRSKSVHSRHKPGVLKTYNNNLEKLNCKISALNASKSRIMTQLKKMAIKLEQEQVYEPVGTLFIVRKRGSLLYRCFGYGELCERFIKGEPLTDYPPYMNR